MVHSKANAPYKLAKDLKKLHCFIGVVRKRNYYYNFKVMTTKSSTNKYGLIRSIPNPVKREVRQKCGFGCVICGAIPFIYHHFDPPYRDAIKHSPGGISLLCSNHHAAAESGLLLKETIIKKVQEPKSIENGFSKHELHFDDKFPVIILGKATFIGNPILIKAFGMSLFSVEKPEETGSPFRINATFYDSSGTLSCEIKENEILCLAANWDISFIKRTIIIRSSPQEIVIRMSINPPNELVIDRLNMLYKGYRIIVDENQETSAFYPDGQMWFTLGSPIFEGNSAVIVIEQG